MPYSIKLALQSLWHEKWINLLSMLTIAIGLLVVALVLSSIYNISLFTKGLPEKFFIVAYLKDGTDERKAQEIAASLKGRGQIEKVTYISKAEALKELKTAMKDAEYILEGLDENPLPASIEIRLKKEAVGPASVRSLSDHLKKIDGVDDVQYGEKLLLSIHSLKVGIERIGLILTAVAVSGIIFICYSTVKILFYRRKDEVETLKLLGASSAFIRTPFVIEGGVIGIAGGVIGMAAIFAFYHSVFYKLGATVPIVRTIVLPQEISLLLPLAGLFLGITGSLIAMGKMKY